MGYKSAREMQIDFRMWRTGDQSYPSQTWPRQNHLLEDNLVIMPTDMSGRRRYRVQTQVRFKVAFPNDFPNDL